MALRAGSLLSLQSAATSSPSRSKNKLEAEAIVTGRNARSKGSRPEPFRLAWTHQPTLTPKMSPFSPFNIFFIRPKSTCDDSFIRRRRADSPWLAPRGRGGQAPAGGGQRAASRKLPTADWPYKRKIRCLDVIDWHHHGLCSMLDDSTSTSDTPTAKGEHPQPTSGRRCPCSNSEEPRNRRGSATRLSVFISPSTLSSSLVPASDWHLAKPRKLSRDKTRLRRLCSPATTPRLAVTTRTIDCGTRSRDNC
jgi:hypothetical protein